MVYFREAACTHVVTLLSEKEDAADIGELVLGNGMEWIWLPLPEGRPPQGHIHDMIAGALESVSGLLNQKASVVVHCSAGIHRTGMFVYALLRFRGYTQQESLSVIASIRSDTALGLNEQSIAWGDQFAT